MKQKELVLSGKKITTPLKAFVMGIVNATPDSFFSRSRGGIDLALKLLDEGADILDIGGESSRPGAAYIDADEELNRIIPLVKKIRKYSDIPISIDTRKKIVMQRAFDEGADILNDISALEDDSELGFWCAREKISLILMHKRGNADIMQENTVYSDVFAQVNSYLEERIKYALACGIEESKIIVDPGIGFGKDLEANKILIEKCGSLCQGKFPVLMALSRKSCIGQMTGKDTENRLSGTIAANLVAVSRGASIIRVHDVEAAVDSLKVYSALSQRED